jgi:small GTP-binding protein
MSNLDEYDFLFKLIIVGDSNVGKTNIMSKYIHNQFNQHSKSTIGVEFGTKIVNIDNKKIKAQIWDTAGQERYKAITSAYYKGAKGAFVVYDITRKQSFDSVDRWINDLRAAADKNLSIIIIGNKCDLEDQRQVNKEQGEDKAKNYEVAFMETSALSGENLDKAFEKMINEVYKKCHEEMMAEVDVDIVGKSEDINLEKTKPKNPDKKKCC